MDDKGKESSGQAQDQPDGGQEDRVVWASPRLCLLLHLSNQPSCVVLSQYTRALKLITTTKDDTKGRWIPGRRVQVGPEAQKTN
ncbi:MAG: hypothetical protein Q9220_006986 [cf. Caloplaca sp. 1 TL-2023]